MSVDMKIVKVTWIDACTSHGWQDKGASIKTTAVFTVGFLWEETEDYVAVALSVDEVGQGADIISIPKVGIKSFEEME